MGTRLCPGAGQQGTQSADAGLDPPSNHKTHMGPWAWSPCSLGPERWPRDIQGPPHWLDEAGDAPRGNGIFPVSQGRGDEREMAASSHASPSK